MVGSRKQLTLIYPLYLLKLIIHEPHYIETKIQRNTSTLDTSLSSAGPIYL